ncbi:Cyclin-Dependent Kinase [Seminavis robusta]|uniref:Cyclin-Dependent Kinase n=1 Tax=Seminavis robusta TaxID=568900 RepID=A0A9N8H2F9_9STRA|nr:Cyclin-Dependent Kinase [Seminavis robusta]|eukprot:Sro18_g013030.1 Cyclin-Dependent Kinase (417) ;mRNA; f:129866-131116
MNNFLHRACQVLALALLLTICTLSNNVFFYAWSRTSTNGEQGQTTVIVDTTRGAAAPMTSAFDVALKEFTQVLHKNPQDTALLPWTSYLPDREEVHFPVLSSALIQAAFGNKKVAFVGDSTSYYLVRWMQALMLNFTAQEQNAILLSNSSGGLQEANRRINPSSDVNVGWANGSPTIIQGKTAADSTRAFRDTYIQWEGRRGGIMKSCSYDAEWRHIRLQKPHVLVVQVGLHWLHFEKAGRDASSCYMNHVVHYEEWLRGIVTLAEQVGIRLLLLKTTNFVCDQNYEGAYRRAAKDYGKARQEMKEDGTNNIIQQCIQSFQVKLSNDSKYNITAPQLYRYCRDATFDEHGAQHLNQRTFDFVAKKGNEGKNVTIAIFNDHDLQSCDYTAIGDGRHYHDLNLIRIRLLAIVIKELFH